MIPIEHLKINLRIILRNIKEESKAAKTDMQRVHLHGQETAYQEILKLLK